MNYSQILEIASCTDPGMVRSHNEDSIASDPANGLVVLADGMGGYNAGEVVECSATSFQVTAQGGRIEVLKAKLGDGKKVAAGDLLASGSIKAGQLLGS